MNNAFANIDLTDVNAVLAALPSIIAAIPGGKEVKAAAYAAEAHLEETNPTEISVMGIHIHYNQLPVQVKRGVLAMIFGPPDAVPAVADAAKALIAQTRPPATPA